VTGEAALAGVGAAATGVDRVGDGGAQNLVDDQQGIDFLGDGGRGAVAQYPATEDAGLELQVGRFDLPALVVERDQRAAG
jgi:hypothetical protein